MDTVLPILFEAAQAQQPDLRSCAIYAFGLIAERAPERSSLAAQVAQICVGMVTAADARAETNEFASDNAVVGAIIAARLRQHMPPIGAVRTAPFLSYQ